MNVNKLKGAMVRAGHTQSTFAEALNMSKNTLNAKINGRSKITTDEAKAMCEVLCIYDNAEKIEIFLD